MTLAADPAGLQERDLDALREMTNIGCGHAASALSRLVGDRRVSIEVPCSAVL
ncbi:MAG: chemotaxis protein CheC, partial [Myxococcales bacterium]